MKKKILRANHKASMKKKIRRANHKASMKKKIRRANHKAYMKKKIRRANHKASMTNNLRKAMMKRSELETKFYRTKNTVDQVAYKKQKNFISRLYKRERRKFYEPGYP